VINKIQDTWRKIQNKIQDTWRKIQNKIQYIWKKIQMYIAPCILYIVICYVILYEN